MTTFTDAVVNQAALTANGMVARVSTANANLDYFFRAPALRGKDVLSLFVSAYVEDRELALRITQWMRDVRGGAGERQLFRDVLMFVAAYDIDAARALMHKTPEIGRWDDLLVIEGPLKQEAFAMIAQALRDGNRLCAKWMPRQGAKAAELHAFMGWTPKQWRKTLVSLTNVVEQQMCANEWDAIVFDQVPSLASARYRTAFNRHTPKFAEYVQKLATGEATVNANAVYPYDVLKQVNVYGMTKTELDHVVAQCRDENLRLHLGLHAQTESVDFERVVFLGDLLAAESIVQESHDVAHLLVGLDERYAVPLFDDHVARRADTDRKTTRCRVGQRRNALRERGR